MLPRLPHLLGRFGDKKTGLPFGNPAVRYSQILGPVVFCPRLTTGLAFSWSVSYLAVTERVGRLHRHRQDVAVADTKYITLDHDIDVAQNLVGD